MLHMQISAIQASQSMPDEGANFSPYIPAGLWDAQLQTSLRAFTTKYRDALLLLAAGIATLLVLPTPAAAQSHNYLMYVGTYTGKESKGIYAFRYDADTGKATPLGLAAETPNPTFLAVHPSRKFLYAANEISDFDPAGSGAASAFAIDRSTGKLTLLNQVSARGGGTCYITVDRAGKNALVANYGGGSVAVLSLARNGRLREASAFVQHTGSSADRSRQEAPHAHCIEVSPDQRFALAADLGLDQVLVYHFDAKKGSLAPSDPSSAKVTPGWGPRHMAFHPSGRFVYLISELGSKVTTFAFDEGPGKLTELQSLSTLPGDFAGENNTAEIAVHPSGRFVYGSNRGHNSIAMFSVDSVAGILTFVETVPTGGKWPRNFEIDPSGQFLLVANQNSGDIFTFRIDPQTGRLTPTGRALQVPSPVCIKFVAVN
jgi:6-phosphogluconolactonase